MIDEPPRTAVPGLATARRCGPRLPSARTGQDVEAAEGLIQLSRLVQVIHGQVADSQGLTPVQARMICILAFGSQGMAELARCLGVEKATLTGLADRAERRGLVTRVPVPGDRRALNVTLTPAGRRAAAAFHADATDRVSSLLGPLTSVERDQLRRAMAKIVTGPDEAERADAPGKGSHGRAPKKDSP